MVVDLAVTTVNAAHPRASPNVTLLGAHAQLLTPAGVGATTARYLSPDTTSPSTVNVPKAPAGG